MEARAHDIPIAEAEISVTAWRVLDDLGAVLLLDLRAALSAVTVRDAVLCLIGWRLAREVARALARRHR